MVLAMTSGRGPCVQPHQNFPVTHLQLYFTVSCLHLVHLLAEPQLESCCELMWEAGRQGNAGLIHLQPETCRKSFTLFYVLHNALIHNHLCSTLCQVNTVIPSQPQDGGGWQHQDKRVAPLPRQINMNF